ncbi:MAG: hypothetical protein KC731_24815 [Myxococcales bacterium]|nr:hypothetical protein [Myxococcales bacterium]
MPPAFVVRWSAALARWLRRQALRLAPPQFGLLDVVSSRWLSDALGALARLGVPEALAHGPRTAADVAAELDLDAAALGRLLRALAREELLTESSDGRFGLTALTRPLCASDPASIRSMVLNLTADHNARTWSALHLSIRSGERVWDDLHGTDMWTWMEQHPEAGDLFHGAMAELTRDVAPSVVSAYPFERHDSLVDLGGGTGTLLAAILSANPPLRGVLVDRAGVVDQAPAVFAEWQVGERADILAGDVFDAVPEGRGAYLAKHILHGYGDERAVQILKLWRRAMRDDSRLLLVEVVVPDPGEPFMAMLDLQMLVSSFGGRERTHAEWTELLVAGGFELRAVHPTASPFMVIEAAPLAAAEG